jgi:integrase/recombinase XerD
MSRRLAGPMARQMEKFLAFKRSLGYGYVRSEFTLRAFGRFLACEGRRMHFKNAVLAFLSRPAGRLPRKPVSLANEFAPIRQFCLYLRRRDPRAFVPDRTWARHPPSTFVPHVFSSAEIRLMLRQVARVPRPACRSRCPGSLMRMLILTLYCTGIRFGEAVRLRITDVRSGALPVEGKGRARWVPFHPSLGREFQRYLRWRSAHEPSDGSAPLFVDSHGQPLTVRHVSDAIRRLLRAVGLKPQSGRRGPRPYDLRHTYACHRLAQWYRAGVDVQSRLAWLSAYMGHTNVCGTEKYLHGTAALLGIASRRFRRRFVRR